MSHEIKKYLDYLDETDRMLENRGILLNTKHLKKYIDSYINGDYRPHFDVPAIPITVVIKKWSVNVFETYHKAQGYTYIRHTFLCAKGYREHCQTLGKSQCEYCKWTAARDKELREHEKDWNIYRR